MWIVKVALSRPYTFVVLALLLFLVAPIMILRTPVDIFPSINVPVVSIIWTYTGLVPSEMETRITSIYERALTTTVDNIEHIESQSLNGVSVVKVYLQPNANVDGAIAEVIAEAQATMKQLPPGITPPLVIRYDASTVPILQLGLSGQGLSEQQLNDLGVNFIRPQLATIPGAAVPIPYGGKVRQIMVDIDSQELTAKGLSATDIVNAVNAQNVILPSGTAKINSTEYNVGLNGTPVTVKELNNIPVKSVNGAVVYLHDVAHVRDGYAVQTNIVRQDGQRGVLLSIQKSGNASTLDIVSGVRALLPRIAASMPSQLVMRPLLDQSIFVRASLQGVLREGLIAAGLTSILILVFLGSWRSTLIICISIPLSILTSVLILSALGETINIMTLGGLALAVGILVDDATVEIENIERQLGLGKELRQAILDGAQQIAVPAFVSTLCISIVFVPMFFLSGVARYLFVPLAEAVVFALLASYFFSRTIIPTLVMFLLRKEVERKRSVHSAEESGWFARLHRRFDEAFLKLQNAYSSLLLLCLNHRALFATCFLVFCLLSLTLVRILGNDFFPSVDTGQFRLHVRAKTGMRIEETARLVDQIERSIRAKIPAWELSGILDNIGLPTSGINLSYSNAGTIGNADAEILGSLNTKHHPTADYIARMREELPKEFPGTEFFFQPADIVSQTLNFGLPSPIDIQIVGKNTNANFAVASQIAEKMRAIPGAVDVHIQQLMDQPRLQFDLDRVRAQEVGLTARDVSSGLLVSLSSSFQTSPNLWLNPQNGVSYNIAVQTPQYKVNSLDALRTIPITGTTGSSAELFENLTSMRLMEEPAVASHYNVQPVIDVYASVQGRDLGSVAAEVKKITDTAAKQLPKGSFLVTRGQVSTMRSSFVGLFAGLAFAIALVYLLLVVNFQSWSEAFIIITALPGALAGICWMLFLTRTSLSVPALMGAIMSIGVATANSVLVITFANERFAETRNAFKAALEAGATRLRPVMMTALAMIIGMVPMALGLGEGGEQNAPLGRAVIGGLLFATVATLFFVPTVFALMRHRSGMDHTSEETPNGR
ncbi:efflux RND transporter permease subunit [Alloacidobacterium dinghuense]|uniref:Efflux RND transporter permease subunit n=1 Tax=Alloacidobacterium dinghuense TaxID=2763107 RepID=A0A7G8BJ49_9BACT|nr:efflux RND transporter permease subunit [Alloacidobacterium dinghuense]QNI32569.1 efflux RND transporter permease subunit [Alloacidobacterium dinghuense]